MTTFEMEKHTIEEQLSFYEKYYDSLNKLQGGTDKAKNAKELSSKLLVIAEDQINSELDLQKKANSEKKNITQQQMNDEVANAQLLKKIETDRVNNSIISEVDKAKAIEEINKGYLAEVEAIKVEYDNGEKARTAEQATLLQASYDMRALIIADNGQSELEQRQQFLDLDHEQTLAALDAEFEAHKKTAAEVAAIKGIEEKKYASATKKIDKEVAATKRTAVIGAAQDAIKAAQDVFGESKSLAVAAALINTYQGITAVWAAKPSLPAPYDTISRVASTAVVAASGFASVRNILSTNKGSSSGSNPSAGGGSASPSASKDFVSPAQTATIARIEPSPNQASQNTMQQVLVVETLDEVKKSQIIKLKSNG